MRSNQGPGDQLDLDRVAIGPYCVFDDFKHQQIISTFNDRKTELLSFPPDPEMDPFGTSPQSPFNEAGYLDGNGNQIPTTSSSDEATRQAAWADWMRWEMPQEQTQYDFQNNVLISDFQDVLDPSQSKIESDGMSANFSTMPPPAKSIDSGFEFGSNANPPPFGFSVSAPSADIFPSPGVAIGGLFASGTSDGIWSAPLNEKEKTGMPRPHTDLQNRRESRDVSQASAGNSSPEMEPSQSTPSLQHSPTSTSEGPGVSSSATSPDVPIESSSKKRKASTAESEKPTTHGPRSKKLAHNVIEKRYRNNLNDKFQMLRNRVPTMRAMLRGVEIEGSDMEDLEGLAPAHNFSKSTILTKAIEYIDHLEKLEKQEKKRINQVSEENSALKDEIATLRARLDAYEHNSVQTPLGLHHPVTPPEHIHYHEDPFAVAPQGRPVSQGIPQGMIPVPENMRNLHRSAQPQPHYATQNIYYPRMHNRVTQGQQMQPRLVHSNGQMLTGRLGKAMIGGFAGLMLLQGFREREESSGRALFSFPTYVLQYLRAILFPPGSGFGVTDNFINLLKIVLFVGSVLYCLEPTFVYIHYLYVILSDIPIGHEGKQRQRPSPPPRAISAAPSVASPVEIRRKAWLTAIQTVWVPRHNILFELSALALKIVKIAVRNAIGWRGYSRITGMTEEQEAGRIKAWEIALDAQLTGGDEEISMSRLLLSFMASWTLPSNPSRSLIRSLQSRIIARDFANAKYGAGSVIEVISMTVAKYYWEKAVEQRSTFRTDNAPLSPHIATLLSLEFSEVMVPSVIQRAFNLAWNKSSAADTDADAAMDNVVLDSAIYSPLDAVAAWTSTLSLQRILARYLENDVSSDDQLAKALQVTIDVAPPTSQARARALVAKAIIVDQHRAINVAEAFHELPCHPTSPVSDSPGRVTLINAVGNAPIANDIRVSLALAKCLELLSYGVNQPGGPSAYTRALDLINKASLYEMDFSWLSFAAMYTMLVTLASDKVFIQEAGHGLEAMASHMRTWKGLQVDQTELSSEAIKRIITKCTEVSKYVVGLKASVGKGEVVEDGVDDGYASLETMSVHAGD